MKKFLALVCMITCIFGLTACGSEEISESKAMYEADKLQYAQQLATERVVPLLVSYMDDDMAESLDIYTAEEISVLIANDENLNIDGYVMQTAIESFHSAKDSMGNVTGIAGATAEIDDDTIIVDVEVTGEKKNATAEVIISNDLFMKVESVALNPINSMGELMGKAALNTLIGMGTVFAVLILISLIISCFKAIPTIQAKLTKKKEEPKSGVDNAVTQIAVQEEVTEETDDLELVAVIAAAIAASEGAASTDGFVVRSIRRRA